MEMKAVSRLSSITDELISDEVIISFDFKVTAERIK